MTYHYHLIGLPLVFGFDFTSLIDTNTIEPIAHANRTLRLLEKMFIQSLELFSALITLLIIKNT